MKSMVRAFLAVVLMVFVMAGSAAADGKVVVTREQNKPATVEIKSGEAVRWTNSTGGTAHIVFAGHEAIQFYVGGKEGSMVRVEKPGTYEYVVHISGVKSHAHNGTVVVK